MGWMVTLLWRMRGLGGGLWGLYFVIISLLDLERVESEPSSTSKMARKIALSMVGERVCHEGSSYDRSMIEGCEV